MSNIQLIPFRAEHALMFQNHGTYIETPENAVIKELRGPAFSAIINNEVIGCAGVIINDHFGSGWALFSKKALEKPLWLTRTVKHILEDIIRAHKLRRVEVVVVVENEEALKWARVLGFERECSCDTGCCVARNYTPNGESVIRFELVRTYGL